MTKLMKRVREFNAARAWNKFLDPRSIILALCGELGELAHHFRWRTRSGKKLSVAKRAEVENEIADIFIFMFALCLEVSASLPLEITEMRKWAEFLIDRYKVKLRGPFDDYSEAPELISFEKDDIFRISIHGEKTSQGIDSKTSLLIRLQEQLYENQKALNVEVLTQICSQANIRGHLAILTQPYLDKIIVGKKTIESRFSKMRVPPFYKVRKGDILLLKEAAGPIAAIASVSNVRFFGPLKPRDVELVMTENSDGLALEESFTKAKQNSKYATLINIGEVLPVKPLALAKSDRRAWVVLNDGIQNRLF